MFDHLLESSQWDDSNKWSNIEFGEEITQAVSVEVNFTHLIWSSDLWMLLKASSINMEDLFVGVKYKLQKMFTENIIHFQLSKTL